MASEYGCQVTGLDLTDAYCRLAARLSGWVGLSARTEFRRGDALSMPCDDGVFDLVAVGTALHHEARAAPRADPSVRC